MLSGLETRSLGLNTLSTTESPASSQSVPVSRTPNGLLGWTSTKQGVNVTCSKPQRTATRPGLEPGTPWSVVRDVIHCASPLVRSPRRYPLHQSPHKKWAPPRENKLVFEVWGGLAQWWASRTTDQAVLTDEFICQFTLNLAYFCLFKMKVCGEIGTCRTCKSWRPSEETRCIS